MPDRAKDARDMAMAAADALVNALRDAADKTTDAAKMRALEAVTCWTQALFDMRINYKPEKPNFLVTVRAYALPQAIEVPYHEDYAGCHSWVPLKNELTAVGTPVLSDEAFEAARAAVLKIVAE